MLRVLLVIDDYNELIYLQTLLKKLGFDVEGLQNQKKYADLSLAFNPQLLIATARGAKIDGLALAKTVRKNRGFPKVIILRSAGQAVLQEELEDAGVDMMLDSPINPKELILALASFGNMDEAALLEKYSKIKGLMPVSRGEGQREPLSEELLGPTRLTKAENQAGRDGSGVSQSGSGEARFRLRTGSAEMNLDPGATDMTEAGEAAVKTMRRESLSGLDGAHPSRPLSEETYLDESRIDKPAKPQIEIPKNDPARQTRFVKWQQKIGPLPKQSFNRERIIEFNKKIRAAPAPEDIDVIEDERKKFVKALFKKP